MVEFLVVIVCLGTIVGLFQPSLLRIKFLNSRWKVGLIGFFGILILSILAPEPPLTEEQRQVESEKKEKYIQNFSNAFAHTLQMQRHVERRGHRDDERQQRATAERQNARLRRPGRAAGR